VLYEDEDAANQASTNLTSQSTGVVLVLSRHVSNILTTRHPFPAATTRQACIFSVHDPGCDRTFRARKDLPMAAVPSGPARARRPATLRLLLPPFAIAAALLTAGTLVLMAATIDLVPFPARVHSRLALTTAVPATATFPATHVAPPEGTDRLLLSADHLVVPPAPCGLELARLTYRPGRGGTSRTPPGPWLLVVESGVLTVHLLDPGTAGHDGDPTHIVLGDRSLHAGDGLSVPRATTIVLANDGITPVVALAAGVFSNVGRTSAPGKIEWSRWDASWSPGATVQPLGGGWLIAPAPAPIALSLQRLSLLTGDQRPLRPPGAAILAVEMGTLTLVDDQGLIMQQSPDGPDEAVDPVRPATLLPGEGAFLQDRPEAILRNDGSASLEVVLLTAVAS
jgi:hypothetical protein